MRKWSVAEAKAHLSRVIHEAKDEAQAIQNRGVDVAVLIDATTYRTLLASAERSKPAARLQRFLRLSEAIRAAGGATIAIKKRKARLTPFAPRKR